MAEKKTKAKKAVVANGKSSNNRWQVVALVVLVTFFVISLLILWLYASNKPNYRDLDKAYNKLNIPSDWQLVSQSSNKGLGGMFCSSGTTDTSPCPVLSKEFKIKYIKYDQIYFNQIFNELFSSYSESKNANVNCNNIGENDYRCYKEFTHENISIYSSVSSLDSKGKNGSWATIVITPTN